MIHHPSTAGSEAPHSALFSRLGVLNGLTRTPARLSGRKLHCAQRLATFVTNPGESCGFIRQRTTSQILAFSDQEKKTEAISLGYRPTVGWFQSRFRFRNRSVSRPRQPLLQGFQIPRATVLCSGVPLHFKGLRSEPRVSQSSTPWVMGAEFVLGPRVEPERDHRFVPCACKNHHRDPPSS